MLDAPTLIVALALDDLVLGAVLWLAIAGRERRGVDAWGGSLALQALALVLVGARAGGGGPVGGAALLASVVAVNACIAVSVTLQLAAVLAFFKRPLPRPWHAAAALGGALVGGALAMQPAPRLAATSVLFAAGMIALGLVTRRLAGSDGGRGARLVTVGAFAGTAVLVGRAIAALVWPARISATHGAVPSLSLVATHAITLATSLGFVLMHRERHDRDAERLALTDALTGVYNRRTLFDLGDKELLRARRTGASLSLLFIDLDHFKRVNDKFGHLGGDAVLVRFVEVVRAGLRQSDVLTRIGGEEFCVLLPDVGGAGAKLVGERTRASIEASTFFIGAVPLKVTASVGVATLPSGDRELTLATLVARAEQAMNIAKRDGRNRVSVAKAA